MSYFRKFKKLKTIDFSNMGLGDNIMAWSGLYALLINDVNVISEKCIMYVPDKIRNIADFIFSDFGINIESISIPNKLNNISPVFSPHAPHGRKALEWYKSFIGPDWRVNCFEALDCQKIIPRYKFRETIKGKIRLSMTEHVFYKHNSWKEAQPSYLGYRMWLPILRKFNIFPLSFLVMIKNSLKPLRRKVISYVNKIQNNYKYIPNVAIFPSGNSFQAFTPEFCRRLADSLSSLNLDFYIPKNDLWYDDYKNSCIRSHDLKSIEETLFLIKSSNKLITTDSFSSHIAQIIRDDFILVLSRDIRENVLHPGATPRIVVKHPPCAPCNYVSRDKSSRCVAGFTHCHAFDDINLPLNIRNEIIC